MLRALLIAQLLLFSAFAQFDEFGVIQAPVSPPSEISRTPTSKRCPEGFESLGKECVRVVTIPSSRSCSPGAELTLDDNCATYIPKTATCDVGFEQIGNRCEHFESIPSRMACPAGYTLTDAGCVPPPTELPPSEECPAGSVRRGDLCLRDEEREPELACPPRYTLEGKKCRIEELYNCTPPRPENPTAAAAEEPVVFSAVPVANGGYLAGGNSRSAAPTTATSSSAASYNAAASYAGRASSAGRTIVATPSLGVVFVPGSERRNWRRMQAILGKEVEEGNLDYVLQATCKRIRTIAAEKICPQGVLNGKLCRIEVEVPPILVPPFVFSRGFDDGSIPPEPDCPQGYSLLSRTECTLEELRGVAYVCPERASDVGDRCAMYARAVPTCPQEFVLENEATCVRTLHAPVIQEYSVTFSCTGKECPQ